MAYQVHVRSNHAGKQCRRSSKSETTSKHAINIQSKSSIVLRRDYAGEKNVWGRCQFLKMRWCTWTAHRIIADRILPRAFWEPWEENATARRRPRIVAISCVVEEATIRWKFGMLNVVIANSFGVAKSDARHANILEIWILVNKVWERADGWILWWFGEFD